MNEHVIKKLTSGKFWLTIIAGITFAYGVYARIIPDAAAASIITAVFMSYFQKHNDGTNINDRSNG